MAAMEEAVAKVVDVDDFSASDLGAIRAKVPPEHAPLRAKLHPRPSPAAS